MFCKKGVEEENFSYSFFTNPEIILGTTNLTEQQKILYRRRFMKKVYMLRRYKHVYAVLFYIHKFLSTTLGVAIPALLSIQYYVDSGNNLNNPIYWSAWALSLFGGFVSGYSNIFKVDERFFLLRAIYQKLKYEGWSFILLCKKYDVNDDFGHKMLHDQLFTMFMESIEQIIDDYKKNDMETIMDNNKSNENEIVEMQQRARIASSPEQLSTPVATSYPPSFQAMNTVGADSEPINTSAGIQPMNLPTPTRELVERYNNIIQTRV